MLTLKPDEKLEDPSFDLLDISKISEGSLSIDINAGTFIAPAEIFDVDPDDYDISDSIPTELQSTYCSWFRVSSPQYQPNDVSETSAQDSVVESITWALDSEAPSDSQDSDLCALQTSLEKSEKDHTLSLDVSKQHIIESIYENYETLRNIANQNLTIVPEFLIDCANLINKNAHLIDDLIETVKQTKFYIAELLVEYFKNLDDDNMLKKFELLPLSFEYYSNIGLEEKADKVKYIYNTWAFEAFFSKNKKNCSTQDLLPALKILNQITPDKIKQYSPEWLCYYTKHYSELGSNLLRGIRRSTEKDKDFLFTLCREILVKAIQCCEYALEIQNPIKQLPNSNRVSIKYKNNIIKLLDQSYRDEKHLADSKNTDGSIPSRFRKRKSDVLNGTHCTLFSPDQPKEKSLKQESGHAPHNKKKPR